MFQVPLSLSLMGIKMITGSRIILYIKMVAHISLEIVDSVVL